MELRPGYKQTEAGVIPEEWEVKHLHEVAEIWSGIAKNAGTKVSDPIRVHYLRVANVQDGYLDLSDISHLEISRSDLHRFSVLPGDVLMNEGGDRDKLGRGSIWRGEFQPCVHQNHVFVVRCGRSVTPNFLTTWSAGWTARKYFLRAGKQTTNLASINKTSLGELPVVLPNEQEQCAIAEALSDVDEALGALDRLIAKKHDLKQAAMQQLLTGHIRLPGFIGEWKVLRLGDLADMASGGTPPSSVPAYYDGDIPWVSIADITRAGKVITSTERTLTPLGLSNSAAQMFPAGTVLYAMYASLGECSIAGIAVCTSQAILGIRPKERLDSEFLYYFLTSIRSDVKTRGQQGTQSNLNKGMVQNLRLALPIQEEQVAIAVILSDMDSEITALEQRRDKIRALKQAMMQELLTGRTRLVTPRKHEQQVSP